MSAFFRWTTIDEDGKVHNVTDKEMFLEEKQSAVGGLIEYVPGIPSDAWMPVAHEGRILKAQVVDVIVNEEGRLRQMPCNHLATMAAFGEARYLHAVMQGPDRLLVGPAIIACKVDPNAEEVTWEEFLQVGEAAQAIVNAQIAGPSKQGLYPMWGNYE